MRDPRLRSGRAARRPDDCDDDAGDDHRAGEKHQPDFPNCFPARFFWEAILLFILAKCLILLVQLGGLEPPTSCSTDRRSNQLSYNCILCRRQKGAPNGAETRCNAALWQGLREPLFWTLGKRSKFALASAPPAKTCLRRTSAPQQKARAGSPGFFWH